MADGEKFQGWPVVESEVTSDATIADLMTCELGVDHSVEDVRWIGRIDVLDVGQTVAP
ncbi:MAG: hypothetical protein JRD89_07930 [Deltaproteobacteria bacterium]|nr:hypothetical protein [Deltaproteobacteria bacterium]